MLFVSVISFYTGSWFGLMVPKSNARTCKQLKRVMLTTTNGKDPPVVLSFQLDTVIKI